MNHHQQHEDKTDDLKAKLERLKAEAASLGLDAPLPSGGYRGYRGRGRGASRSYFRGGPVMRGGPARGSMKLDNRPKKLLVKSVHEDGSQALRDWYETTGQLESVESVEAEAGAYLISFKSRAAAEQGLTKGTNIPIIGPVQISWYTGGKTTTNGTTSTPVHAVVSKSTPTTTKPSGGGITGVVERSNGSSSSKIGSERAQTPDIHHSRLQEEEIFASGWDGDRDDGDGMGML